jgi:hypothetical protein
VGASWDLELPTLKILSAVDFAYRADVQILCLLVTCPVSRHLGSPWYFALMAKISYQLRIERLSELQFAQEIGGLAVTLAYVRVARGSCNGQIHNYLEVHNC